MRASRLLARLEVLEELNGSHERLRQPRIVTSGPRLWRRLPPSQPLRRHRREGVALKGKGLPSRRTTSITEAVVKRAEPWQRSRRVVGNRAPVAVAPWLVNETATAAAVAKKAHRPARDGPEAELREDRLPEIHRRPGTTPNPVPSIRSTNRQ